MVSVTQTIFTTTGTTVTAAQNMFSVAQTMFRCHEFRKRDRFSSVIATAAGQIAAADAYIQTKRGKSLL
jgi:hypothetical protein